MTVFILKSALNSIRREAARFLIKETGGILIGYWTKSGNIVVTHASGPGSKAYNGYFSFEIDVVYCQGYLDYIFDTTGGALSYLGEWHTHPLGYGLNLSSTDSLNMHHIAMDKSYKCSAPVVILYRPKGSISKKGELLKIFFHSGEDNKKLLSRVKIIEKIHGYVLPTLP